jgi:Holliday junction resolvasome RuvABC endonuclease subunit
MTLYIGLDLSLTSPGIAVYDTGSDQWSLYGFVQRNRDIGTTYRKEDSNVSIQMLPKIPTSGMSSNEERYEHIRSNLMNCILVQYKDRIEKVVVAIECYAFAAKNTGSSYKLQELGGVIKHSIHCAFPSWTQVIITPGAWKKQTVGNGRASKQDVVVHVCTNGPCVNLMDVFGMSHNKNCSIPCPVQDLADAVCIVIAATKVSLK